MEKQKINVRVGGKNYTLVSSDPPEYVRRVAALVDRRLNEMQIASGMALQQASVLTCFNLADELLKAPDSKLELMALENDPDAKIAKNEKPAKNTIRERQGI